MDWQAGQLLSSISWPYPGIAPGGANTNPNPYPGANPG